jgi:transcriptional regulator NrdR family protein
MCGGSLKVLDSRTTFKTTIRKRQCKECKEVFYTKEERIDKEEYTKLYKKAIEQAEYY